MKKAIFVVGFAASALFLSAEDKLPTEPVFVKAQTIVTVEARHDHALNVPSLKLEDMKAYERQESLQVTDLVPLEAENGGLQLFLLIDDASSMTLGSQFGDLRHFIETQTAKTWVGIGYMRNGTVFLEKDLTPNHSEAAKALRLPLSYGGAMTSPYLSLTDLIKRWPATSDRREVVFITSGIDPLGDMGTMNPYMDTAIEEAQRQGIIVYAIYTPTLGHAQHSFWRLTWAQNHLAQLAEETGGESYMLGFGPPVSFAPDLESIAARLAHQYRVSLLMKAEDKGALRNVKFATQVPNAELVAPSRIFVPAAH